MGKHVSAAPRKATCGGPEARQDCVRTAAARGSRWMLVQPDEDRATQQTMMGAGYEERRDSEPYKAVYHPLDGSAESFHVEGRGEVSGGGKIESIPKVLTVEDTCTCIRSKSGHQPCPSANLL